MRKIKIGDRVRCKDTGFKGYVDAIATYKYGCVQICVQPEVDEKGDWIKHRWIDEPAIEIVKDNGRKKDKPKHGGMDRSHPGDD